MGVGVEGAARGVWGRQSAHLIVHGPLHDAVDDVLRQLRFRDGVARADLPVPEHDVGVACVCVLGWVGGFSHATIVFMNVLKNAYNVDGYISS